MQTFTKFTVNKLSATFKIITVDLYPKKSKQSNKIYITYLMLTKPSVHNLKIHCLQNSLCHTGSAIKREKEMFNKIT